MKMLIGALLTTLSLSTFAYRLGETAQDIVIPHIDVTGTVAPKELLSGEASSGMKVIEFFLTTCPLCNANRPVFSRLANEFRGVALFKLVGIDRPNRRTGKPDALTNYIAAHRAELLDDVGLDHDRAAYNLYDISETPTLYVLNADNEVVYKHAHQTINSKAEAAIRKILQGK